ncbi:hypothetical protein [Moorena sp. SIO4G3]|uniref:hypothetical protein n=1 Tax=Moorena sp. SIO4G3 TaxID=2607821 RepID=UPI0025CD47B4|nr:hypothetical protein [Moorena sp. SIO4G3]
MTDNLAAQSQEKTFDIPFVATLTKFWEYLSKLLDSNGKNPAKDYRIMYQLDTRPFAHLANQLHPDFFVFLRTQVRVV